MKSVLLEILADGMTVLITVINNGIRDDYIIKDIDQLQVVDRRVGASIESGPSVRGFNAPRTEHPR